MNIKKYISAGLVLLLLLTVLTGCGSKNTGTTMRLEKTQGTVGVEDDKDARIEARDGMQLYSGYEVGTAESSLAWIGLDDSKALKMDANSTAEVSQSGKVLKVDLYAGKLFFDVSQPLADNETFTIETSTMVTGIRGTSGWIEIIDEYTTRLTLLEGTVTVESRDPATGETRSTTITGGQIITVVYHGDAAGYGHGSENAAIDALIDSNVIFSDNIVHSEDGLRVEELQEKNVPDFVKTEIAQSKDIQEKITENTDLSVPEILEGVSLPEDNTGDGTQDPAGESSGGTPETPENDNIPEDPSQPEESDSSSTSSDRVPIGTEVYYEKVTEEYWEAVEIYPDDEPDNGDTTPGNPDDGTDPDDPDTDTNPDDSTGSGGTDTPVTGETSKTSTRTEYSPQIQLFPSEDNPSYAKITQANEVTTTVTYTSNATGKVTRIEESTQIVPISGAQVQYDYNLTDGYVNFKNLSNNEVKLSIEMLTPPPA